MAKEDPTSVGDMDVVEQAGNIQDVTEQPPSTINSPEKSEEQSSGPTSTHVSLTHMTTAQLVEFPSFKKLSIEVRYMVWDYSIPPPSVVRLELPHSIKVTPGGEHPSTANITITPAGYYRSVYNSSDKPYIHAISRVCRESRVFFRFKTGFKPITFTRQHPYASQAILWKEFGLKETEYGPEGVGHIYSTAERGCYMNMDVDSLLLVEAESMFSRLQTLAWKLDLSNLRSLIILDRVRLADPNNTFTSASSIQSLCPNLVELKVLISGEHSLSRVNDGGHLLSLGIDVDDNVQSTFLEATQTSVQSLRAWINYTFDVRQRENRHYEFLVRNNILRMVSDLRSSLRVFENRRSDLLAGNASAYWQRVNLQAAIPVAYKTYKPIASDLRNPSLLQQMAYIHNDTTILRYNLAHVKGPGTLMQFRDSFPIPDMPCRDDRTFFDSYDLPPQTPDA